MYSQIQTFSTSFRIRPTTFSTKSSTDTSSLCLVGSKSSSLGESLWIGEDVFSDLTKFGISWCKLFKGALRLFDLCFHLSSVLVERSECWDLFGVPLFTRLSRTLLSGCLEGVTSATTCQSCNFNKYLSMSFKTKIWL